MENKRIEDADFSQTGYSYTLSLIAGKYKPVILYCLMEYEPVRFNQMQRYLGKIADKTLSAALKELERDGLIRRESVQSDARLKSLIPTQKAIELDAQVNACLRQADQCLTKGLSDAQLAAFKAIAAQMSANLDE